jgi:RNA polymerase sigma-70 factor (ECF subfamily)
LKSDVELIEQAQGGSVGAVGELYDNHHQPIFRYVWSRVRDKQLAEDLTGEIFMRMVTNLTSYQPAGVPFRAWLYRIARNMVVDHFRSENGRSPIPLVQIEQLSDGKGRPATIVEKQLDLERIQTALVKLDPAQQEVIILRFISGLPLSEVADSLDKSVAAVKSLQHRGLKALRVALKQV